MEILEVWGTYLEVLWGKGSEGLVVDMENLGVVGFLSEVGYPVTNLGEEQESRDSLGFSMFRGLDFDF
jgi:hypothetical protein